MGKGKNILLCTLGTTWPVIAEAMAIVDPGLCPLYANHPDKRELEKVREEAGFNPVDELWVCTTEDETIEKQLDSLREWVTLLNRTRPLAVRIWQTSEISDISTEAAGNQIRELIYRTILCGWEATQPGGQLNLCLAGGRKTMSADMQRAGGLIGCHSLLHILAPAYKELPVILKNPRPHDLVHPLEREACKGLIPLVIGKGYRSELLDIPTFRKNGPTPIRSEYFPLELPESGQSCHWKMDHGAESLVSTIEKRQRDSYRLLGNYLGELTREEPHENWRALYRLPPSYIEKLRKKEVSEETRALVQTLPKADLHRHIGGCMDIDGARRVAECIWSATSSPDREKALELTAEYRDSGPKTEWPWDWPRQLKASQYRSIATAALLLHTDRTVLEHNLFGVTEPRFGLQKTKHGFSGYERPGELSGSALLLHPAATVPYMEEVLKAAQAEGVRHLELRGSPQKYRESLEEQLAFIKQLKETAENHQYKELSVSFIVILDRRKREDWEKVVELAVRAHEELDGFVVGIDVAGDEQQDSRETVRQLAQVMDPVYRACMPVTIHAGEGTPAEKIWEAAYLLHADRVGHGLTLREHPQLLKRFRDRNICLEMCPTSNCEVVGFTSANYPLQQYWREGVPLAVCTDNPAISRTDSTGELFTASGLCPVPLTLWDVLAITKQGFSHSFLPADMKMRLMKELDLEVFETIQKNRAILG